MLFWRAQHETGDMSEWWENQGSDPNVTEPPASVIVTDEASYIGDYALKFHCPGINNNQRAARMNRHAVSSEEYFSAWYMMPFVPLPEHGGWPGDSWLAIMQGFKLDYPDVGGPEFMLYVKDADCQAVLQLHQVYGGVAWSQQTQFAPLVPPMPIVAGEWFNVEMYIKDGIADGEVKVWHDDVLLWSLSNHDTRGLGSQVAFGVACYGANIPNTVDMMLYVDDCKSISVGP